MGEEKYGRDMNTVESINIERVLNIPEIRTIIDSVKKIDEKKTLWGVAPVAPLNFGFDALILLQKALISSGYIHTILLSNFHAMMTHGLSYSETDIRCNYYRYYLSNICGLDATFIRGSDFQTRPGYTEDLYSTLKSITISKIKDSFPVSRKKDPFLAYKVIYPIMQCIDCYHTDSRIVISEEGQKKIYRLLEEIKMVIPFRDNWSYDRTYKETYFFYIPTSHDIMGNPLIVSNAKTRISVHETDESLNKKVKQIYAPPGKKLEDGKVNALLEFFKYSVFPWTSKSIRINTINGLVEYEDYRDLESDYNKELIAPQDAKDVLYNQLSERLKKIQNEFTMGITHWIDIKRAI